MDNNNKYLIQVWLDIGENSVKFWSNSGLDLVKIWSNSGQNSVTPGPALDVTPVI